MNKSIKLILTLCLALPAMVSGQEILMERVSICAGECVDIGLYVNDNFCYSWESSAEIDNPQDAVITICPESNDLYVFRITDDDGNLALVIEYEIFIFEEGVDDIEDFLIEEGFVPMNITVTNNPGLMESPCVEYTHIINYVGEMEVETEFGEVGCVTDLIHEQIYSTRSEMGYEDFEAIITDKFCDDQSIFDLSDFLSFGKNSDGALQIFIIDNQGDSDFMYMRAVNGAEETDIIDPDPTYFVTTNSCIGALSPEATTCNITVASSTNDGENHVAYIRDPNAGGQWAESYSVRYNRDPNFFPENTPNDDRDNWFNDANYINQNHWSGLSFLTKTSQNWSTSRQLRNAFRSIMIGSASTSAGCLGFKGECGAAARRFAAAFDDSDTRNIDYYMNEKFAQYLFYNGTVQNTFEQIAFKIESCYRNLLDLEPLFVESSLYPQYYFGHRPNNIWDIPNPNFSNPFANMGAFATIGGTQNIIIDIIEFEHECTTGEVNFRVRLTVQDIFGAGLSDGSKLFPGLNEMFVMQHYRNYNCHPNSLIEPCYTPLKFSLELCFSDSFII